MKRLFLSIVLTSAFLPGCGRNQYQIVDKFSDQGPNELAEWTYLQGPPKDQVDLIVINDNSPSMGKVQSDVSAKFPAFISSLSGVNWRLAMTTTDVSTGRFGLKGRFIQSLSGQPVVLDRQTPNVESTFRSLMVRPETLDCERQGFDPAACPSSDERPILATILAIQRQDQRQFFRAASELAVFIITNEDEELRPDTTNSPSVGSIENLQKALALQFPNKSLTVHSTLVPTNDPNCLAKQSDQTQDRVSFGTYIQNVVQQFGGSIGSICEPDYSAVLSRLSLRIRESLTRVKLPKRVIPETVSVTFNPARNIGFRADAENLYFSEIIPEGTEVKVQYRFFLSEN